jgi:hypothetical protein
MKTLALALDPKELAALEDPTGLWESLRENLG